jgi:hypothetical protein
MTQWTKDELQKISDTDDLHISPFRDDGTTYGTPTWIWSVVVNNTVYVRPYNGEKSRWFQAALKQKSGRITAGGITKEVAFEKAEDAVNDQVNEAYSAKYSCSPYVTAMIDKRLRPTTMAVSPR